MLVFYFYHFDSEVGRQTRTYGWKHTTMAKKCCHDYFFKIMQLSTSMKPILKEVFINYTKNMVVQFPNNAIVKRN
jgi:hypothetical protein